MRWFAVLTLGALLAASGCRARRRQSQLVEAAHRAIDCSTDEFSFYPRENLTMAECEGRLASCDTFGGVWSCSPEVRADDPPEQLAARALAVRGNCPVDRIVMQEKRTLEDGRTGVGFIACDQRVVCAVAVGGEVSCRPEEAGAPSAEPVPAVGCEPACRTGYVCVKARCVSACNPACRPEEQCTAGGECVTRK